MTQFPMAGGSRQGMAGHVTTDYITALVSSSQLFILHYIRYIKQLSIVHNYKQQQKQ